MKYLMVLDGWSNRRIRHAVDSVRARPGKIPLDDVVKAIDDATKSSLFTFPVDSEVLRRSGKDLFWTSPAGHHAIMYPIYDGTVDLRHLIRCKNLNPSYL